MGLKFSSFPRYFYPTSSLSLKTLNFYKRRIGIYRNNLKVKNSSQLYRKGRFDGKIEDDKRGKRR
jgi:hypothetical protein